MIFKAILFIGALGIGASTMGTFDRRPAEPKLPLVGLSLKAQLEQASARVVIAEGRSRGLEAALADMTAKRDALNNAATLTVETESSACDRRGSSSFRNGYDQGVSVGRRQCNGSTLPLADPERPPAVSVPDDDLATGFNSGLYAP